MASAVRTQAACEKAAMTLCQQYWAEAKREADLAAQHLASLSIERRAQLEREWSNK